MARRKDAETLLDMRGDELVIGRSALARSSWTQFSSRIKVRDLLDLWRVLEEYILKLDLKLMKSKPLIMAYLWIRYLFPWYRYLAQG